MIFQPTMKKGVEQIVILPKTNASPDVLSEVNNIYKNKSPTALANDASDFAVGPALELPIQCSWKPLTCFSCKHISVTILLFTLL